MKTHYVQYHTERPGTDHNMVEGYVIDQMTSPLTGKMRLLVADGPNDNPVTAGKWVDADLCNATYPLATKG